MGSKSKIAFFSALLVMLSSGSLPASAAAVTPAALSWSANSTAPMTSADLNVAKQISTTQTGHAFVKFTSALAVGDTWALSVSITKPAGSAITMSDSNGAAAAGTGVFTGGYIANWGTPAYSSVSGLITGQVTSATSASAFVRVGLFSITPDAPGDYEIRVTAMADAGAGWQAAGVTQKLALRVYDLISATATLVQTANFGTGVELDSDGNIFWLDYSGNKIYKTTTAGLTSQFSLTPVANSSKLFVEGGWLYVQSGDRIYRIALNNTNSSAVPKIVRSKEGMLSTAFYDQALGYTRIGGHDYVAMSHTSAGQIWRYPVSSEPVAVASYSIASNLVTLTVAAGHGFAVGDTARVNGVGSITWASKTIAEVSATSIKFPFTSSNVTTTPTPSGQVALEVAAPTLIKAVPGQPRGMAPSSNGRYLYLAVGSQKNILRLDLQNTQGALEVFADLTPVDFRPDDVTYLDDGSLLVSAFSSNGELWHLGADGKLLNKISVTLNGVNVSNGYDLRVSPDGSTIYLAAQSTGFLSLALSRSLSGSTRGTSNLLQPTSGPIPATAAAASVYDSAASNISTTSALLRGTVNPNGSLTQTQLRWSTDPSFPPGATSLSPIQNLTGSTAQAVEHLATSLSANTTYYFQLMAGVASTSEVFGGVRSFNTSALPGITAIAPGTGPAAGGTSIQLSIQGFSSTPTVKVGGVLATNVVFTAPSTLTFDTPPQAGTGIFLEYGAIVAYAAFTYAPPLITAISPVSGLESGGFAVTVSGSNFTGATGFTVNGIATTFSFVSDGLLTFTAPANSSGSKTIQVTTPSGTAAIQLTYEPALPSPAPTQSAPSAPSTPSNPAPEAPTVRAPRAVISVTLSKGVVDRKSRIVLTLPEASQDSPINSVRVHLKNARGEITQTLVIPLNEKTDTLDFEVPLAYGDYDVSVSTFNAAGYSSELVNVAGIVAKDTISGISSTKWPTIKGVKMPRSLLFEPNSSRLTTAAKKSLLVMRENLKGFNGRVLVSGFAAKFGPASRGRQISTARALAVARELKALGLNSWIEYHGYGQLPSSARGMRRVDVSLMEYSMLKK